MNRTYSEEIRRIRRRKLIKTLAGWAGDILAAVIMVGTILMMMFLAWAVTPL